MWLVGFIIALTGVVATDAADDDVLWNNVCTEQDTRDLPFCDLSLPRKTRVADYVQRVDLESKARMMINQAGSFDPLHIPAYQWWSEGLHGPLQPCVCLPVPNNDDICKCPTSFPCPSSLGSAFNNSLYNLIGSTIGREGRAINNLRVRTDNPNGDGIDYWSPTINMQRDPRWGRNQEVPGEDPVLTSQYAVNFVRGLQEGVEDDSNNDFVQIVACCKHFVGNSMENWNGYARNNFDAKISKADLANYYLPAFRACVMEGKSLGIMCSYNAVNGKPTCANEWLLDTTLRKSWGFEGYVTSDCGAIQDIYLPEPQGHGYATSPANATAMAIAAGTDVDCGPVYKSHLLEAVKQGMLTKEQVDVSFARLVDIQMRLGLFDNNKRSQPYFRYGIHDIDSESHQSLALEAAQQSIVLLKNEGGVLPLQRGRRVAVIGPHFNATVAFLSNYHGSRCPGGGKHDASCIVTPLTAISAANENGSTEGSLGCKVNSDTADGIPAAIAAASLADDIVLMVGIDTSVEHEGGDRYDTILPGLQVELITQVLALNNPSTTLVVMSGGAMSLGPLVDTAPAILWAGYGGERAAEGLASVLYGSYNPTGKLAATWYPPEYVNQIPMTEMGLAVPPGRTHMFYSGQAEFAFGHGLSYTTWSLDWADTNDLSSDATHQVEVATNDVLAGKTLTFDIEVSNTGNRAGKHTVLLFVAVPTPSNQDDLQLPLKQKLLGYEGVDSVLLPGERCTVQFRVKASQLAVADAVTGDKIVTPGTYKLMFQDGQQQLEKIVLVHGPPVIVEEFLVEGNTGKEEGGNRNEKDLSADLLRDGTSATEM